VFELTGFGSIPPSALLSVSTALVMNSHHNNPLPHIFFGVSLDFAEILACFIHTLPAARHLFCVSPPAPFSIWEIPIPIPVSIPLTAVF